MTPADSPFPAPTPATRPWLITGGSVPLAGDVQRSWLTNWPVHLAVLGTAALGVGMSPGPLAVALALAWVLVYLAGHWAHVMRQLPGAGEVTVVASSGLALALMAVSGQGVHLFAAFPLVWMFLVTFRRGLVGTLVLAAAMVGVLIATSEDPSVAEALAYSAFGAAIVLFSTFMAAWVWRVETLSHQHRELAERLQQTVSDLEATRAELARSEHARGAEEERARIAADIHDTLAQSFTSITMLAQAARQTASQPSSLLDQIEEVSRNGLGEARGLIAGSQASLDLAASIERLCSDLAERTGISVTSCTSGWTAAPTRTEVVLLRTAQEALRNVERHAQAGRVGVRLALQHGEARLEVTDDGAGFDPALPTAGFGLAGMRSRLESEGGSLQITTSRGAGTTLTALLPPHPDHVEDSHDH